MLKHIIGFTIRNILRNKFFSSLSIIGLSLGFAGAIFIILWVFDELSYDQFHKKIDNIYMVINRNTDDQGNSVDYIESPAPMADYLVNNIPEVKASARVEYFYRGGIIQKGDETFKEKGASVDASFFHIFSVELLRGNKNNIFNNPESIVISESMAKRYFGSRNPMGKILKVKGYSETFKTVVITGVYKDFPGNSSLQLDFMIPFNLEKKYYSDNWNVSIYATFVLLNNKMNYQKVNDKVAQVYSKVINDNRYTSYLFPYKKLHLHSTLPFFNNENQGNIKLIYIMIFTAILILIIACINYMNLITSRSIKRIKEVSIKKIFGAKQLKIFFEFLTEAFLYILISFHIAIILVELLRPAFNRITGKSITIFYTKPEIYLVAIVIIAITAIIASVYPYLYINSYKPAFFVQDKMIKPTRKIIARKILVVVQFSISMILIIFSGVILKQVNYIYSKDLGFNKDHIMVVGTSGLGDQQDVFKSEIMKNPGVISATLGNTPMRSGWPDSWSWKGIDKDNKMSVIQINSDPDYLETLQIDLLKGRFFFKEYKDSNSIVINKAFANLVDDESILGKEIFYRGQAFKVIGVTDNFYSNHFSNKMKPVAFFNEPTHSILIKLKKDQVYNTINEIESVFISINAELPFEFTMLEEIFNDLYKTEVKTGKLFAYFSFLAIFISCLGLLGISIFSSEQRTKEIGIRKVLGASSSNISRMLHIEFIQLVGIAYVISCPIAYYISKNWLQQFVYRTELSWWIFLVTGFVILFIALLTISWYGYRAAGKNPIDSLRYE